MDHLPIAPFASHRFFRVLLILTWVLSAAFLPADDNSKSTGYGESEYRSIMEIERAILDDGDWLADADRLMEELKMLDVQMYTLLNRCGSNDAKNHLIRERSNIRRLIVDLTEARNFAYIRLIEHLRERDIMAASSGLKSPRGILAHSAFIRFPSSYSQL